MNLSEWLDDVRGRVIGSGQCVALAQDYSARVTQGGFLSTDTGPWPGYAGNIWYADIPGYVKKSKTEIMLPGWLPVWGKGPFTPATHIAVAIAAAGIGVKCMTQNPGAAQVQTISKVGLLGYLAPGNNTGAGNAVLAGDIITDTTKTVQGVNALKEWASDAGNWQRVGLYALGAILILFVLLNFTKGEIIG